MATKRKLDWEGCNNVRDLGGLRTRDGRLTRWGAVVRSDSPGRLTEAGWSALYAHGIRTILTLRTRFPAGNYTVELLDPIGPPLLAAFTVGPRMPQTPPPGTVPAVNYSGMWWIALESGWGLSISQGPTNQLFAVWFVYDAAGMPTWYTLELGSWRVYWNESTYSGSVYKYAGPYFATTFDPNMVVGTLVGTGTLTFWDAYTARFEYTIAGTTRSKAITRLPIE